MRKTYIDLQLVGLDKGVVFSLQDEQKQDYCGGCLTPMPRNLQGALGLSCVLCRVRFCSACWKEVLWRFTCRLCIEGEL